MRAPHIHSNWISQTQCHQLITIEQIKLNSFRVNRKKGETFCVNANESDEWQRCKEWASECDEECVLKSMYTRKWLQTFFFLFHFSLVGVVVHDQNKNGLKIGANYMKKSIVNRKKKEHRPTMKQLSTQKKDEMAISLINFFSPLRSLFSVHWLMSRSFFQDIFTARRTIRIVIAIRRNKIAGFSHWSRILFCSTVFYANSVEKCLK